VKKKRPGLWTETALGLAVVTLLAMVLSAGVVGLYFKVEEAERRTDLAVETARGLTTQLEAEAVSQAPNYDRILRPYVSRIPDKGSLWFVDKHYQVLSLGVGVPPATMDTGVRGALFSKRSAMEAVGSRVGQRTLVITEPVMRGAVVVGALRFSAPLDTKGPFGGQWRALILYVFCSSTVIAGFGFLLFRRRLVQPILAIQQATHAIAGGDFGKAVTVDGPRELMELSQALTSMSVALSTFRVQSQEQVASLEQANLALVSTQADLVQSEKLATVGRLASGIAHEVGNPLAAVVGYVELLSQGLSDKDLEGEILQRCGAELDRIQRIIGDLLEYARLEDLEFESVSVGELLEKAISRVRLLPDFGGLELSLMVQDDLPNVWIQREKVNQVLLNLLINSADALGGSGGIQLEAGLDAEWVAIRCLDTGPGFEKENLDRLFDPFFTTKAPGAGTGLGLAISQRIAQAQAGKLTAGNRKQGGAWVCLQLPRVPA
jgi:two-component system NtrC family sensor kinase